MKAIIIILGVIMCSCGNKGGMLYVYTCNGHRFIDRERVQLVDSMYVMPKTRTKQERYQNAYPTDSLIVKVK